MKLTLTIDMDNAAFEDGNAGPELARILRRVAASVKDDDASALVGYVGPLMDCNGNKVGKVQVSP